MMRRSLIIWTSFFFLMSICFDAFAAKKKDEWKEFKKPHFIIYYQDAPYDLVESVHEAAERYYREITNNLGFTRYKGWTWDERAKIYIYNDAESYVNLAKAYGWSHGMASPRDKVIRTFPAAHGFFDSTLPHELGHIIFREFVGFKAQVPPWFEEGVAMYQEKAKRWGSDDIVRRAIESGDFMPLSELSSFRPTNRTPKHLVDLFYAESASIVGYLIREQGKFRFERFCRELKEGRPFEWVLTSVYVRFRDLDHLNKNWVEHLTK